MIHANGNLAGARSKATYLQNSLEWGWKSPEGGLKMRYARLKKDRMCTKECWGGGGSTFVHRDYKASSNSHKVAQKPAFPPTLSGRARCLNQRKTWPSLMATRQGSIP